MNNMTVKMICLIKVYYGVLNELYEQIISDR